MSGVWDVEGQGGCLELLGHPPLPSSSSDTESDYGSITAPCAQSCEERPQLPESPPLSKPLTRHISLRETLTQPVSLLRHREEPQAMPGE